MGVTGKRRLLVIARHGQSDGNRRNVFTGWRDLPLTSVGVDEARTVGKNLARLDVRFDAAFSSALTRASRTCELILGELGLSALPILRNAALNERDYGALTGLDKNEARERWGEEQVRLWRRSYAAAPPDGESLRDTIARVLPYYVRTVLPTVMNSDATLLVAHGNSCRALLMALENFTPETIPFVEFATGETRIYRFEDNARATLIDKASMTASPGRL
jgi:2,3-bisphosphoglycerate-dependent phosphoglycerate mutase